MKSSKLKFNVPSSRYTTIRTGGNFKSFAQVSDIEGLKSVISEDKENFRIIGNGSNLLINDFGLDGLTVRLAGTFKDFTSQERGIFSLGAGCNLMQVSRKLSDAGFSGLEFAAGIPGSVGGAVVMNAGAHGSEMSNIINSVVVMTDTLEIATIKSCDLDFGYRRSSFKERYVILSVNVKLCSGDKFSISKNLRSCLDYRKSTQPLTKPSFGSVFKNPKGHENSAAWYIQECGLKGKSFGGAVISDMHSNWIINNGDATTSDIINLINCCKKSVFERFGIELQEEVRHWIR